MTSPSTASMPFPDCIHQDCYTREKPTSILFCFPGHAVWHTESWFPDWELNPCLLHWEHGIFLFFPFKYLFLAALDLKFQHTGSLVVECGFRCPLACRILAPRPGMELRSPARWILNHWTAREAHFYLV